MDLLWLWSLCVCSSCEPTSQWVSDPNSHFSVRSWASGHSWICCVDQMFVVCNICKPRVFSGEFQCGFEEEALCLFSQDKADEFDWTRHRAASRDTKSTPNTGPSADRSGSKQGTTTDTNTFLSATDRFKGTYSWSCFSQRVNVPKHTKMLHLIWVFLHNCYSKNIRVRSALLIAASCFRCFFFNTRFKTWASVEETTVCTLLGWHWALQRPSKSESNI